MGWAFESHGRIRSPSPPASVERHAVGAGRRKLAVVDPAGADWHFFGVGVEDGDDSPANAICRLGVLLDLSVLIVSQGPASRSTQASMDRRVGLGRRSQHVPHEQKTDRGK